MHMCLTTKHAPPYSVPPSHVSSATEARGTSHRGYQATGGTDLPSELGLVQSPVITLERTTLVKVTQHPNCQKPLNHITQVVEVVF